VRGGCGELHRRQETLTHFTEERAREKVTVPRGPVDPGAEAQIDYGRRAQVGDPSGAVFTLSTLRD
jgi:hypothetical protein